MNWINRTQESKPRRFFKPRQAPCYACSMPGLYHCEISSCRLPLCVKHRVRKAGGDLCAKHKNSQLVQEAAEPTTKKFADAGEAMPHEEE